MNTATLIQNNTIITAINSIFKIIQIHPLAGSEFSSACRYMHTHAASGPPSLMYSDLSLASDAHANEVSGCGSSSDTDHLEGSKCENDPGENYFEASDELEPAPGSDDDDHDDNSESEAGLCNLRADYLSDGGMACERSLQMASEGSWSAEESEEI
jgi:hypothetical protein